MARLLTCLLASFFILGVTYTHGQTITSQADGPWNVAGTWAGGVIPDATNSTSIVINHNITIPAGYSVTIDQTSVSASRTLTVQNTGTLNINSAVNPALSVAGTLTANAGSTISGTSLANAANVTFASGATYRHELVIGQSVPFATWNANSIFQIVGFTGGASIISTSWSQQFGNVEFNCAGLAGVANFTGLLNNIAGYLRVINTGATGTFQLSSGAGTKTINIGGNLSIEGSSRITFTTDGNLTTNIGGALSIVSTNTNMQIVAGQVLTGGTSVVNVNTDFTLDIPATAQFRLCNGANSVSGTVNVKGNFNFVSGIMDETSTAGKGTIGFTGVAQSFTRGVSSDIPTNSTIDFTIAGSSTVDFGTSVIRGLGTFTLNGGIKVGATDAGGSIQTGTSAGNIRVNTRIYGLGAKIEYGGTGTQFIGNGHPNGSTIVATMSNPNGVSLASNVIIGGSLSLTNGSNLNVLASRVLTLGGTVTANGNFITVTPTSSLVLNGSSVSGTFPFPAADQTFTSLTLNRPSGGVTFASNVTISNSVLLTDGQLNFSNRTLTLNGTFNAVSGTLTSNATSVLNIGGAGNFGTLMFTPGNTLGTLTMNRTGSGSVNLNSDVTISSALNLTQGDFYNDFGLTMGNNSTITRNVVSQLFSNRPMVSPGGRYNLTYEGVNAIDTGLELPESTSPDDLNNLIIDGGPISLVQDVTVNGNITFTSGSLAAGGSVLTMRGSLWTDNAGDFTPELGIVIFDGSTTVTGSSTPQLGSIELGTGSSLTFPSGSVNLSGDMNFVVGSTFNANGSTMILNGSSTQFLGAGGAVFTNITVNKSGGSDVALVSPMSIGGTLNVQSSSEFAAEGFLTLLSTSDGVTGNAIVAPLLSGADITGDVTTQRHMNGEGRIYRYISSPVMTATVDSLMDDFPITGTFSDPSTGPGLNSSVPSFYYYDETAAGGLQAGYIPYPNTGVASENFLVPARGYVAFIREASLSTVWDVTGPINKGNIDFGVTFSDTGNPAADGWNLVGNPYPSPISWNNVAGWDTVSISPTIAVKDNGVEGGGAFRYWDGAIGSFNNGSIAIGQAFWIRTLADDAFMEINENAKVSSGAVFNRERNEEPDYFSITIRSSKYRDDAYVRIREGAQATFDKFDATKFTNENLGLATITSDGFTAAINALNEMPCSGPMKLDFALTKDVNGKILSALIGTYKINIEKFGKFTRGTYRLYDRFTNTTTDLTDATFYQFQVTSVASSYANNRFELLFDDGDMLLDQPIAYNSTACEASLISLSIPNSISDYTYYVTWKDTKVSGDLSGNGEALTFEVDAKLLDKDVNALVVNVQGYCRTEKLSQVASVAVEAMPQFTVADIKACNTSESTFIVSGAAEGTTFRWYKNIDDQQAIAESSDNQFTATGLKESRSFYVEAVSSSGCVSERIPAEVEVVYFDDAVIHEYTAGYLESNYDAGNQWFFNNDSIQGATQKTLHADKSGVYKVEVSVNGCITGSEYEKIVTGVEEKEEGLVIYPNVVHTELNIKASSLPEDKAIIRVYDLAGRLMSSKEIRNGQAGFHTTVDFKGFVNGVYVVKINNGRKQYEAKIIKE